MPSLRRRLSWIVAFAFGTPCWAADGHLLLFESGGEGYPRYRIPSLVVTNSGTLLAVCEGRADGGGLTGNVDLVCKRSTDSGKTWSGLKLVADRGEDTVGNQSVLVDRETGVIWIAHTISPGEHLEDAITRGGPGVGIQLKSGRLLFLCYHAEGDKGKTYRSHAIFSDDHGKTWKLGASAGVGNVEPQVLQREANSALRWLKN